MEVELARSDALKNYKLVIAFNSRPLTFSTKETNAFSHPYIFINLTPSTLSLISFYNQFKYFKTMRVDRSKLIYNSRICILIFQVKNWLHFKSNNNLRRDNQKHDKNTHNSKVA
jgi:hypothetical protein